MGASVDVQGLDPDSVQGDRAVADLLGRKAIDATHVPDLVPALAAVAAQLPQRTVITGAARLRLKESDRLQTVAAMLKALGHGVTVTQDGLIIDGGEPNSCGEPIRTVDGADDHRIVMAAAVAAAHADKPVRILGAQAVEKSYPDFFRDFTALGGNMHVEHAG
jgi:3-phosphoshikimate 1-carboxyvinyltransferase